MDMKIIFSCEYLRVPNAHERCVNLLNWV